MQIYLTPGQSVSLRLNATVFNNGAIGRRVVVIAVGARPILAPGWSGSARTDLALIDCDVHQTVKKVDDLFPYLPRVYREQVRSRASASRLRLLQRRQATPPAPTWPRLRRDWPSTTGASAATTTSGCASSTSTSGTSTRRC